MSEPASKLFEAIAANTPPKIQIDGGGDYDFPAQTEMFNDAPIQRIAERLDIFLGAAFNISTPCIKTRLDAYALITRNRGYFIRSIGAHFKIPQLAAAEIVDRCQTFGELYDAILEKVQK